MARAALLLSLLWVLGASPPAFAFETRAGQALVVTERIVDDLYASGGTIDVTGTVEGDLVATGGTVALSGPVGGGVLAVGGTVRLGGVVAQTARTAAGAVTVGGRIGNDLVLLGGTVSFERGADVGRDLVAIGRTVFIWGNVGRRARLNGNSVIIGGSIRGDVAVNAGTIVLLPTARINGRLRYMANRPAEIHQGAHVVGGVERMARPGGVYRELQQRVPYAGRVLEGLWLLVLGFMVVAVAPGGVPQVVDRVRHRPGPALLTGFLLLVTVPVASVLIALTVVGTPLAVVLILLYGATVYPSQVFVAAWLGDFFVRPLARRAPSLYVAQTIGTVILVAIVALPVAGMIIRLLALLLGFGALWSALWAARPRPKAFVFD